MGKLRAVLAANLERLLRDKGLEKQELANRAKMPASTISRYLAKKRSANLDSVERLANALGVGASELLAAGPLPVREVEHNLDECVKRVTDAALAHRPAELSEAARADLLAAGIPAEVLERYFGPAARRRKAE